MKLSSILLSVAEIIIFACWFFFPLQHFNLLQEQHSDLQQTTDCHWRGRKTDKNWVLYPNHQNECCWCLGLVWRRSSSSLVLSPQTQLEIQNKKHLVWGKLFKMNLDLSVFWWITKQLYSRFSWNYVSRIQNRTVWRSATLRGEEGLTRPSCWASFSSGAAALDLCDALRRRKYHRKLKCGAVTSEVTSRRQRVRRTQ